jgi:hypothetical protein
VENSAITRRVIGGVQHLREDAAKPNVVSVVSMSGLLSALADRREVYLVWLRRKLYPFVVNMDAVAQTYTSAHALIQVK